MGLLSIFGKPKAQLMAEQVASILLKKYNDLVEIINMKGGQEFLDQGQIISDVQLDRLIRLCHPDKHDNSDAATKATQWLLNIKDSR